MRSWIVANGCQNVVRGTACTTSARERGGAKWTRGAAATGATSTRIVTALTGAFVVDAQQGCIFAATRM